MKNKTSEINQTCPSNSLTLNGVTYKTGGNIVFSDQAEGNYILAASPMLDNVDKAIEKGILENGMQMLMRKVAG